MLTGSGQAANFYAVFNIAGAGDHIVSSTAIYGGTYNLFNVTLRKLGIDFTFVSPSATEEELAAAIRPNTKAIFGETISNPSLEILDIEKFARVAHKAGVPLIVDNTFATPINCRPFDFGCDIVTHSTTKYLEGHASTVGGAIVDSGNFDWTQNDKFPGLTTPDDSYHGITYTEAFGKGAYITKAVVQLMRDLGAVQSPNEAFLLNVGLESLHLRIPPPLRERQESGGLLKAAPGGDLGGVRHAGGRSPVRSGAEVYAPRHLRRGELWGQGRPCRRHHLYGQPGAGSHRHPCGRRSHLLPAPGIYHSSPADGRTVGGLRRAPGSGTPERRH